jgi:hypothetical protein
LSSLSSSRSRAPEEPDPETPGEEIPEPEDDLAPLVARAEQRFGENMRDRVKNAVELFTLSWVAHVLFGVERLRNWGGVIGTLKNWQAEGGPPQETISRAEKVMRPAPAIVAKVPARFAPSAAGEPAERDAAEQFLSDLDRQGFSIAADGDRKLRLIDPRRPADDDPLRDGKIATIARERAGLLKRLEAIPPDAKALRPIYAGRIIAEVRDKGMDFRWLEDTGRYQAVGVRPDGRFGANDEKDIQAHGPEIRAILDRERQQPAWVNPVACGWKNPLACRSGVAS